MLFLLNKLDIFNSIDLDNEPIDDNDWIGAFNGDVCVGAALWDLTSCSNGVWHCCWF